MPNSYIPNMLLAFGLVRHTIRYWAWGSRFIEIDGLGLNTMPVQYIYIYIYMRKRRFAISIIQKARV